MGELLNSNKLSVSFFDSLMGERGVLTLSLDVPLLLYTLSPSLEVGEVGDLGDLAALSELDDGDKGVGGDEDEGEKMESSLGVLSILMTGAAPSTDLDLLPPCGDGDRDRLTRLDPNPAL